MLKNDNFNRKTKNFKTFYRISKNGSFSNK